jgi:hypothetical protein
MNVVPGSKDIDGERLAPSHRSLQDDSTVATDAGHTWVLMDREVTTDRVAEPTGPPEMTDKAVRASLPCSVEG